MATRTEIDRLDGEHELETTYGRDSRSNLVWMVNAEGNPTRFTFDGLGRMTKKEVALSYGDPIETFTSAIVTQWGFDDNDRLVSFKDDASHETTWTYDALDRAATMTYPDSTYITYNYDATDDVVETVDAAGNDIEDTCDNLNRMTALEHHAGGLVHRDDLGVLLLRRVESPDGGREQRLHGGLHVRGPGARLDRLHRGPGVRIGDGVHEDRDEHVRRGREIPQVARLPLRPRACRELQRRRGPLLDLGRDEHDRLVHLHRDAAEGDDVPERRDPDEQLRRVPGGGHEHRPRDSSPSTIVRLDYAYNDVHDRIYERYGSSGSSGDAFEYDKARRSHGRLDGLGLAGQPERAAYTKKIEYNYDDDGNRTSVAATPYGQSPATTSYSTNTLNQYTAVGGVSHSWDGNGNLSNDGTLTYEYNYRNEICRVKNGGTTVATYKYDALGRRMDKAVDGGVTERYVYAGVETIATYDGSNTWKEDFVFGQGIDNVLMLEQADVLDFDADQNTSETTRFFYHKNALGSVMAITDMSEATAASDPLRSVRDRHDHAGRADAVDRSTRAALGYAGRYYDEETGGVYSRAREHKTDLTCSAL